MSYTSVFAFCTGPTLRDMYADAPTIYPKIATDVREHAEEYSLLFGKAKYGT